MGGRRMHTPHSTPLDPPLAINYRNHQKSLVCFSHLTPLVLFFFTKRGFLHLRLGRVIQPSVDKYRLRKESTVGHA